jgi:phosphoadenosine phosphosulfate reductase
VRIIMVKKKLADGSPCPKCAQAEDLLRRRGQWQRIDEVVWANEGEANSPGMLLGKRYGIDRAPFFIVAEDDGHETIYESALLLMRERLAVTAVVTHRGDSQPLEGGLDLDLQNSAFHGVEPPAIVRWALDRWGTDCTIAFSGAEDVALIHMAAMTLLPFSVFTLDTGRLHPETYEFIDKVRERYGVLISVLHPDPAELEPLVRAKGLFSFYQDGHQECCAIRKVAPLARALAGKRAWLTGQRRDQSPDTRGELAIIERDARAAGTLVKLNPLAGWSRQQVMDYLVDNDVPQNPLHARGFASIGCAPCTRAIEPGQHERDGRWWWENAEPKECGLHSM